MDKNIKDDSNEQERLRLDRQITELKEHLSALRTRNQSHRIELNSSFNILNEY